MVVNIDKQIRREHVGKINRGWISGGEMRRINTRIANLQLRVITEYRPVHSSFFQIGDTCLLFDFDKKLINCINSGGEILWTSELQVQLGSDWTGNVLYDEIAHRFYLEFLHIQLSYLLEIDPRKGEVLSRIPINKYKHIDHLSVLNNKIFFLHQMDFGDRGKKLYFVKM